MDHNETLKILSESNRKATLDMFNTMCPLPVIEKGIRYNEGVPSIRDKFHIVGVISVTDGCRGSVSVQVPLELGKIITKTMLGMDEIESETDIHDTIGEMSNLVVGGAKTIASSSSLNFDISCPTVITGEPYAIVEPPKSSIFSLLEFEIESHPCLVMSYLV